MADPYELLVKESNVTSSQEDILRRIPGWEEKGEPALSPSQPDLPLSRLCATSGSSTSHEEETEGEREPAFGLQRPLELASPDTQACLGDSYNPAFESDRERSLSPHADRSLFCSIWGSGLITQSQGAFEGITHLAQMDTQELHGIVQKSKGAAAPLADNIVVKNHGNVFADIFNHAFLSRKEERTMGRRQVGEDRGQLNSLEPVMPTNQKGFIRQKTDHNVGMLDCSDKAANHVDSTVVQLGERMSIMPHPTPCNKNRGVSLHAHAMPPSHLVNNGPEESSVMLRPRSSTATLKLSSAHDVENENKRKGNKEDNLQKLKCLKDDTHMQERCKKSSSTNDLRLGEGSQMKVGLEGNSMAGKAATKCALPVVIPNEKSVLESKIMPEANKSSEIGNVDCVPSPKSVMDVVMLVSGVLPTPSPDDPDLLSIVIGTGVSLPLPLRKCNGQLICSSLN